MRLWRGRRRAGLRCQALGADSLRFSDLDSRDGGGHFERGCASDSVGVGDWAAGDGLVDYLASHLLHGGLGRRRRAAAGNLGRC